MPSFRRIALLTVLALVALLVLSSIARSGEGGDGSGGTSLKAARERWDRLTPEQRRKLLEAWERWKRLPPEERRRREEVFDDYLKGMTGKEREDLLEKLRKVKARKDLEELRRKQQRMRRIFDHFEKELPKDLRTRLDALPDDQRMAVLARGTSRMFRVLRERFLASLTPAERKALSGLHGPARFAKIHQIQIEKALAGLDAAERKKIRQLPPEERRARIGALLRKVHEADFKEGRRQVVEEITHLLDLPRDELTAHLRAPRVLPLLREMGFGDDAVLARRLLRLPADRLRKAMVRLREIRAIRDPKERRKAEAALRDSLSK